MLKYRDEGRHPSTRLPSLYALRAFEATVRHGSVLRAARELNLTQGAVSRAVRELEASLGFPQTPQLTGGGAVDLTELGNPYIFRTLGSQRTSVPNVVTYMADDMKAKRVGIVWANADLGKGGRDVFMKTARERGIEVVVDVSTEQGQVYFASDVLNRQGRVGARGYIPLTGDAPVPALREMSAKFRARFGYTPDHNGIQGYIAGHIIEAVVKKVGHLNRKAFAETLHGMTISTDDTPGVLLTTTWDKNGDIDRAGFLAEVQADNTLKVLKTLPRSDGRS